MSGSEYEVEIEVRLEKVAELRIEVTLNPSARVRSSTIYDSHAFVTDLQRHASELLKLVGSNDTWTGKLKVKRFRTEGEHPINK